jgi:hypothetical protein
MKHMTKKIDGERLKALVEAQRDAFKKCVRINLIIHKHKEQLEAANKEQKEALTALAEYVNAHSGYSIIQT